MAKRAAKRAGPDVVPDEPVTPSWRNAWPFWVALVVVVLAAGGIALSYVFRPAEDRASDSAKVQYAINDLYTARNNVDYTAFREHTCGADLNSAGFPSQPEFATQNRQSLETNGRIVIPTISDVTVSGDRATATVHWHFDKKSDQTQTTKVAAIREDGNWKVCKP
ncbi:hypothetical protein QNM97_00800 [Gordonia sp. L191]|uniref:Rv0361 family membrane protein n=1 Tax=Gordonia sp. L191 TaxID=2982699 RepID=UPI0024C065C5|nr:hypothetical protein [Gordonia sp. L191]WHU47590.1 hypothetical protein QNM97_00800 [Gordonia sp. L191]